MPSALSSTLSARRNRISCTSQPNTNPTITPPADAITNVSSALPHDMPTPTAAATATLNAVSAVASLTRLSPVRTVMTRRGSPSRRPMDTAATASGGATTAPSTSAEGNGKPGTSQCATNPTATVVTSTNTTASNAIDRTLARNPRYELSSDAEYSSGGTISVSTRSGRISKSGMPGM